MPKIDFIESLASLGPLNAVQMVELVPHNSFEQVVSRLGLGDSPRDLKPVYDEIARQMQDQLEYQKLRYEIFSTCLDHEDFLFMNHGYQPSGRIGDGPLKYWQASAELYLRTVEDMDLSGARIVEIGCGRGGGLLTLALTSEAKQLTGWDRSRGNITACRRIARQDRRCRFARIDVDRPVLTNERFNLVVNVESSHCYADFPAFLDLVAVLLEPGGFLAMVDARPDQDFDQVRRSLHESRLELLEFEEITDQVIQGLDWQLNVGLKGLRRDQAPPYIDFLEPLLSAKLRAYRTRQLRYFHAVAQNPGKPGYG